MNEDRKDQLDQGIALAKTAIAQCRNAMKIEDETEQLETIRAAHRNMTEAGVMLWRARTVRTKDRG